ncbi:hypothetical protein K435DRAFT_684694, partial [Dendrothele bispora CBS 962.96]
FGENVLSFNSNDNLASVSRNAVTPETVSDDYSMWLKQVVKWISSCPSPNWPIFKAIREDVTAWAGFGGYLTNVLLGHAGLRPWLPTIQVIMSPSRIARLCEAAFEVYWHGHQTNVSRLQKALKYDGRTICATKIDILRYTYVY